MSDTTLLVVAGVAFGLSLAGLIAGLLAFGDAVKEFRHSKDKDSNYGAYLYARATLRSQSFRIVKLVILICIAMLVIFDYQPRQVPVSIGFMVIIVLTTLDSTLDGFVSHRIKRYLTRKLTTKDKRNE